MSALTLDFLNNTTRPKFLKALKNQIFDRMPAFKIFLMNGRTQDATGSYLLWDVIAKRHASIGIISGYETLVNQPINPTAQAQLNYATYYATLAISIIEEKRNSGSMEKLLDMVKIQYDNAQSTLREQMYRHWYDSITSVNGINTIVGLGASVASTPTNTYANINRSTAGNEYWKNGALSTSISTADLKDSTTSYYMPSIMRTAYTSASHDESPDTIFTTKTLYNIYQDIAQTTNLRFNNEVANLGFGGVEFGPGITLMFDDYCPAYGMYFLTSQNWDVHVFSGLNFDDDEPGWRLAENQAAKINHIYWSGQVRCQVPRQQYVLSALGNS